MPTGSSTTFHFRLGACWRMVGTCQGPLTIMARLPEMNWFMTSPWVQLMTSLGMAPLFTRSRISERALMPFALLIWKEVLPLPQRKHRKPKVPSSFWSELMPKPCTLPLVRLEGDALQLVPGLRRLDAGGLQHVLVVVQGERQLLPKGMP